MHHGQPGAVHFILHMPQGTDGALEHAGVGHIEVIAFCLEQLAGLLGLFDAGGSQIHIGPAGEAVF